MLIHQTRTASSEFVFTPYQCAHCRMNTAGVHEYNCPLNPNKKKFEIDPVEDYNDITEPI